MPFPQEYLGARQPKTDGCCMTFQQTKGPRREWTRRSLARSAAATCKDTTHEEVERCMEAWPATVWLLGARSKRRCLLVATRLHEPKATSRMRIISVFVGPAKSEAVYATTYR